MDASHYASLVAFGSSRGISVLNNCVQWLKFVNSLYTTADFFLFNIHFA